MPVNATPLHAGRWTTLLSRYESDEFCPQRHG